MDYELRLEKFSGPIEKLLELIEAKQLEITDLNLAAVTGDFLDYLQTIERTHPRILADFAVIASRLLLIKSKALLPGLPLTAEEEKDIGELELRLKFYKNFKPAIDNLGRLWGRKSFSVSRPFMSGRPTVFYPSANINIQNLHHLLGAIFDALGQLKTEVKTISLPLINLEEKIQEIMLRLQSSINSINSKKKNRPLKFGELRGKRARAEVIVLFLALLHLLERKLIKAEQKNKFSDIIIEKR